MDAQYLHRYDAVTREQAIEAVGIEAVERVERENCEPTGRLMDESCGCSEWAASTVCTSKATGVPVVLSAYYYPLDAEFVGDDGELIELDALDWAIECYGIS